MSDEKILANQAFAVSQFRWGEEIPPQLYNTQSIGDIVVWGSDPKERNLYPDKILELYLHNGNYKRIVEDIAHGIAGTELVCEGREADKLQSALMRIGVNNTYLKKLALQMAIFNGVSTALIWTKATANGLKSAELHSVKSMRISQLRASTPRVDSPIGDVDGYWYAPDWRQVNDYTLQNYRNPAYKPKLFPIYRKQSTHETSELLYTIQPNPVSDYYPVPDAQSVYTAIQIDNEITAFQANYIANGMVSSGIMYYPYRPKQTPHNADKVADADKEELRKIEGKLKENMSGTRNSGKMTVIFYDPSIGGYAENGNRVPVRPELVNPIDTNNDEKFIKLTDMNREKMLTGLGVISQELVGISKSTGFTSQSELLINAEKLTESKVYAPKRDIVLKHINQIVEILGYDASVTITPRRTFKEEYTVDMVTNGLITTNEWRESRGLSPIDEELVIDSETTESGGQVEAARWKRIYDYIIGN